MKPVHSVLKIIDFSVLQMHFELIAPDDLDEMLNPATYFGRYELDLDFSGSENEYFQITMSVDINNVANPLPGYKISAKVATLFQFGDTSSISADEKNSMEGFSTVYMALNNLRGIISAFTANAPFGRYTLPSIDLNDLIQKKRQLIKGPSTGGKRLKKENLKPHKKKIKKSNG